MRPLKRRRSKIKVKNKSTANNFMENLNRTYAEILRVKAKNYANSIITYNHDEDDLAYDLYVRVRNALRDGGYNTLEKLLMLTPFQLCKITNLGANAAEEVGRWLVDILKKKGPNKTYNKTYGEILGVNAGDYANSIITYNRDEDDLAGDLSVRARNVLRHAGHNTLEKLLVLTPSQLRSIQNLGAKTAGEIEGWLADILKREDLLMKDENSEDDQSNKRVLQIIKWRLQGYENSIAELTSREKIIFTKAMKAAELFGNNFCLQLMADETCPYIETITQMLKDLDTRDIMQKWLNDAKEAVLTWKSDLLSKLIRPYLYVFSMSRKENILAELESIFGPNVSLGQYLEAIDAAINLKEDKILSLEEELNAFQSWISDIDIEAICKGIFKQNREIMLDILSARAAGGTLQKIAEHFNITKERIRQLEEKGLEVVKRRLLRKENNLFLLISAHHNGDNRLSKEKIEEVIGREYASILWHCATITKNHGETYFLDSKVAHYDAANRVIIVNNGTSPKYEDIDSSKIRKIIDELPELIETAALQKKLDTITKENNLPRELLEQAALDQYKETGQYSYKNQLTIGQMCDLVLKKCFPNGYKIADKAYIELFMQHLREFFGDKGSITARAIDGKIAQIGVLIDRGKYVHKDYISVDKKVIKSIFNYVKFSAKTVLTDSEIFLALKNIFKGTIITNTYILHGIIKLYNTKYKLYRNTISKSKKKKLDDEFKTFMKLNGIVHKDKICHEFGWKEYNISIMLSRCPEVIGIGGGYFMHVSKLVIDENIRNDIRAYLTAAVQNMPVSKKKLQDYFMFHFPDFMGKNEIYDWDKLFSILQYMFSDEYRFSRPYIYKKDSGRVTTKSILQKYVEDMDSVDISDLLYICEQNKINVPNVNNIIDMLRPEFIRVDEYTLKKFEDVGFTNEMYQEVTNLISRAVKAHNGYMAARNINYFDWYPIINIPWNSYLLESIANMIPDGIHIIKIRTSTYENPLTIFVDERYADDDWDSLLIKLLKKEHAAEPFATKEDIFEWLKEEGLCSDGYPYFLDKDKHVFYDDNGKLRIG